MQEWATSRSYRGGRTGEPAGALRPARSGRRGGSFPRSTIDAAPAAIEAPTSNAQSVAPADRDGRNPNRRGGQAWKGPKEPSRSVGVDAISAVSVARPLRAGIHPTSPSAGWSTGLSTAFGFEPSSYPPLVHTAVEASSSFAGPRLRAGRRGPSRSSARPFTALVARSAAARSSVAQPAWRPVAGSSPIR